MVLAFTEKNTQVLKSANPAAFAVQALFIVVGAVVLPSLAHLTGVPVRVLLPMHWPVILAALLYGWRGGLAVGILSPVTSFMISAMPPASVLPFMSVELAIYGAVCGFARQELKLKGWLAVLAALLSGRLVLVSAYALFGTMPAGVHIAYVLLPGLAAGGLQVILLPLLAGKFVGSDKK